MPASVKEQSCEFLSLLGVPFKKLSMQVTPSKIPEENFGNWSLKHANPSPFVVPFLLCHKTSKPPLRAQFPAISKKVVFILQT